MFTNNIGKVDLGSNKVSSIFSPRNGSFWQNYLFVSNAGPKTVAVVDDDSPNIYRVVTFNLNTPEEQMTLLRKVNGSGTYIYLKEIPSNSTHFSSFRIGLL